MRGWRWGVVIVLAGWLVAAGASAELAWVKGEVRLNLRAGPGTNYKILMGIKTGDALDVLERTTKWTKVRTANDETGWIPAGYLDKEPPPRVRLEQLETETQRLTAACSTS